MKIFCFLTGITIMLAACTPELTVPDFILKELTITQTTSPSQVTRLQPILTNVKMSGPDQCYRFSHFEVIRRDMLLHEIRGKATYPNPDKGTVVCAPSVYTKDTTLSIGTTVSGSYILRFYNGNVLFKTDTVQVN